MTTIATLRDRVEQSLLDVTNTIFTLGLIDEAINQALDDYNRSNPLAKETVLVLPGDGREIAIDSLTGLAKVTEVWWPYDSDATTENWPPNRVTGFRVYWDDARPVLFLDVLDGAQPQQNDELRLWYTAGQTIYGLNSAAATTIPPEHESMIVVGASGVAAMARALDLLETAGTDLYAIGLLATWGRAKQREFAAFLKGLKEMGSRSGPSWGAGWALDKWDAR
jgi:hypothetical protein